MHFDVVNLDRAKPVARESRGDLLLAPFSARGGLAKRVLEARPIEQHPVTRLSHTSLNGRPWPSRRGGRPVPLSPFGPRVACARGARASRTSPETAAETGFAP